jgi:hypothetical protein
MGTKIQNDNIDMTAENTTVDMLDTLFGHIAYLDPDTVRFNLGLASEGGFTKEDRSIRFELANFLMNNFAYVFLGLVINPEFRDSFIQAVKLEIGIDYTDNETKAQMRRDIRLPEMHKKSSKGDYVVDLSKYDDHIFRVINKKLSGSFEKVSDYNDGIDQVIAAMTSNDMINVGFCVSNFMYLIRAFSKNDLFVDYVKTVVSSVKDTLSA